MNKTIGLAAVAALVLGAASVSPASAHGGHHGYHGHGGHHHGGGWHHHGGGGGHHHHPHWGGGWHGSHWGGRPVIVRGGPRIYVDRRPIIVGGGPRRVYVAGGYPVYARPAGYGPGCTTTKRVGLTPWGWHKVVTTRTGIVP